MKFKCPTCGMSLKAEPEMAGKVVRCPGCNTKLQIPESAAATTPSSAVGGAPSAPAAVAFHFLMPLVACRPAAAALLRSN